MLFNSIEFFIFFLIVFSLYWFVFNKNFQIQNLLILISSYFFYCWWDWRFSILILISSITDYFAGLEIHKSDNRDKRTKFLIISLIINIGILLIFKYFNFFIENFILLLNNFNISHSFSVINIILPIGISFYTFQSLSYTIDIYNKKTNPSKNIISFLTFVSFFPQLIAGPIERAKNFMPQLSKPRHFNEKFAISGCKLILVGLFKKMVIADNLSNLVDPIYLNPQDYLGFPLIIATFFFAFQIYCDFSGYSDIAIGVARLLGFKLMKNFRSPYLSFSLTSFWRNWHISLSTWFRDYVYIPLGGNNISKKLTYRNILLTFLISGFWHGANWTFIIWGLIHGTGLIVEKKFDNKISLAQSTFHVKIIKNILTFTFVCTAWIFFRSENISDSILIISNLFYDIPAYFNFDQLSLKFRGIGLKFNDLVFYIFLIFVLIFSEILFKNKQFKKQFKKNRVFRLISYYLILTAILLYGTDNNANNFIYFQF